MSLEKIAKILYVDEVGINHGPKGVAVHVRVDESWRSVAIDNDDLVKSRGPGDTRTDNRIRLEVIAEHLVHLADGSVSKVRSVLNKSQANMNATAAALRADRDADLRRGRGWGSDWFDKPYDGPLRQVTRSEPAPSPTAPPSPAAPEGPAAEQMSSRFHAVMAELRCL